MQRKIADQGMMGKSCAYIIAEVHSQRANPRNSKYIEQGLWDRTNVSHEVEKGSELNVHTYRGPAS